jgi:uncharacterized protein YcgL (UPF0745 family)
MQCYVYKSDVRDNHYLYLSEKVGIHEQADIPEPLMALLGELSFVIEFDLDSQRVLPGADSQQVINDIQSQGFFLQMPKKDLWAEEDQLFN